MATIEMSTDLARMITSILSIGLGGTGSNTALTAFNNLAAGLSAATGGFTDTTDFITTNNSGATNDYYRRSYSILKGNIKTYLTPNIITSIAYSGDGNAVTALSLSTAGVLTVTKGATYNNYSLPLATSSTRGGVKIGYTASGKNYAVQLNNEQMYVNVPWTDHYAWTDITGKPSTFPPSDHTHNYLVSRGNVTAESGSTKPSVSGLSMSQVYNNGYPTTYGNLLTLNGGGCGELLLGWSGSSTADSGVRASIYYRSHRDTADTLWSNWYELLDTGNYLKTIFCNRNATRSTLTATVSSWAVVPEGAVDIFGLALKDTALSSDTGDLRLWLAGSTTLNMRLDGDIYASNFRGALVGNVTGNCSGSSGSCTGNAATATQLQTARTIWGQSFNGTGNITGNFTMSGGDQINMTGASWDGFAFNYQAGKGTTQSTRFYNGNGGEIVRFAGNGNVGIGVTSPTYKLHVAGTIFATGSPAFYASTSTGAWSYVRLHNGSNFWDIATNSGSWSGALDFRPGGAANIGPHISTNGRTEFTNVSNSDYNYGGSAIWIREYQYSGSGSDTWGQAPRLGWHWSGRVAAQIGLASNGYLYEAPVTASNFYKIVIADGSTYNIVATPASHSHTISQVVWNASENLVCNGANTEWSIDMQAAATGSYWHVWSGVNSASCLICYNDNRHVAVPAHLYVGGYNNTSYGLSASSIASNGNLFVNASNTTGGGIVLSDDGSIVDNNDGYCSMRFSYGVAITNGLNANTHRIRLRNTGCIEVQAAEGNWGEGLRIYPTGSWSTILLGGNDLGMGSRGTTASTWSLHNNNGTFYLALGGSSSSSYALMRGQSGAWYWWGNTSGWELGVEDRVRVCSRAAGAEAWAGGAIEVREVAECVGNQSDYTYSPRVGFHWGNRCAGTIGLEADNVMRVRNQGGGSYKTFQAGAVWGAVWNDYVEYREADSIEPGYCYKETESGIMTKTTERLEPGVKLSSDTFGFAIGKTKKAQTPISVSGRVLAYPYKNRNEYHLGDAVCSAPNGTIDVMTREEIMMYPERIIGTVSEIPKYDIWFANGDSECGDIPIEVNGRIWIYVR